MRFSYCFQKRGQNIFRKKAEYIIIKVIVCQSSKEKLKCNIRCSFKYETNNRTKI